MTDLSDAARSYGRAEAFLGSWFAAHPGRRADSTVSSKWGYRYTADWDPSAAVRRGLDLEVGGSRLFTAVQSTWNLLETSVGDALRAAHDDGVLVLVKEGVANGRLVVDPPGPVAAAAETPAVYWSHRGALPWV